MESIKRIYRLHYSYQTGETCFDREYNDRVFNHLADVADNLRILKNGKKDFKFTVYQETLTRENVTVDF